MITVFFNQIIEGEERYGTSKDFYTRKSFQKFMDDNFGKIAIESIHEDWKIQSK